MNSDIRHRLGGLLLIAAALAWLLQPSCASTTDPGNLVPPTVVDDPHLPSIDITVRGKTRSVHIETYGDPNNPVILMLHGSLADFRAMRRFSVLQDEYFVVMWDQRGNGLSERITAQEYTEASIVEEITAIKDRYSPDRPVTLIGHSFGAMYSALYMSRRPDAVDQAVLIEPAGLNGEIFEETFSDIIDINLFNPDMNKMFWQNEVLSPADHEAMDYRALMILYNGRQARYHCDPDNPSYFPVWRPGGHVEHLRADLLGASTSRGGSFDFDFARGLDSFPRQVLFIAGSCSALGPDFQTKWNLPLFNDARLVSIEDAGHRVFTEQWPATESALRSYLRAYQ